MNKLLLTALLSLSSFAAQGQVLNLTAGSTDIRGVNISTGGALQVENRDYALATVGNGLRQKKKLFVMIDVYVAQALTKPGVSINGLSATDALTKIDGQNVFAFDMQFLRDIDGATMADALRESLTANGVDVAAADIQQFLKVVADAGDVTKGQSLVLATERLDDGSEVVTWENTATNKVETLHYAASSGIMKKLISIWFGRIVSSDVGLVNLQASLLKGM